MIARGAPPEKTTSVEASFTQGLAITQRCARARVPFPPHPSQASQCAKAPLTSVSARWASLSADRLCCAWASGLGSAFSSCLLARDDRDWRHGERGSRVLGRYVAETLAWSHTDSFGPQIGARAGNSGPSDALAALDLMVGDYECSRLWRLCPGVSERMGNLAAALARHVQHGAIGNQTICNRPGACENVTCRS